MSKQVLLGLFINIVGLGLGLGLDFYLALKLPAEEFATWRVLFSYVLLVSMLLTFGSSQHLISLGSKSPKITMARYFELTTIHIFLLFIIVLSEIFLFNHEYYLLIVIVSFITIIRSNFILMRSLSIGYGHVFFSQITDRFLTNIIPFILVILLFSLNNPDIKLVAISYVVTFIIILFLTYKSFKYQNIYTKFNIKKTFRLLFTTRVFLHIVRYKKNMLNEGLDTLFRLFPTLISPIILSPINVALFVIFSRLTDSTTFIQTTLNNIYLNKITSQFHSTGHLNFKSFANYFFVCIVLGLFITIIFYFGGSIIVAIIGEEYAFLDNILWLAGLSATLRISAGPVLYLSVLFKQQSVIITFQIAILLLYILTILIMNIDNDLEKFIYVYIIFNSFSTWILLIYLVAKNENNRRISQK